MDEPTQRFADENGRIYTVEKMGGCFIGAAGMDVMEQEPINRDNPLLKLYDKEKILITPHMAWASKESRELLVEKISRNIEQYQKER